MDMILLYFQHLVLCSSPKEETNPLPKGGWVLWGFIERGWRLTFGKESGYSETKKGTIRWITRGEGSTELLVMKGTSICNLYIKH